MAKDIEDHEWDTMIALAAKRSMDAMPTTKAEAAAFLFRYGNAGRSVKELLDTPPTKAQLNAACQRASLEGQNMAVINKARDLILDDCGPTRN